MFIHRQRMETRTMMAVAAVMRFGNRVADVTLANASSRGVLAMVDAPPARGVAVELTVGDRVLKGQVRWRAHDRCGIALKEPIDVAELIEGKAIPVVYVPEKLARRSAMELLRSFLN
ncbi:pilus assembly protein [Novosphingobium guangzhouense]|uniref:Pilus assembly protein n=1 Tax=Novosphingobium guangzhouense TaxID=1850347 RepID=A0A2K2G6A4_9SPHN|nr:pilus assembly protein [Novosphingobium guangzhouense]PNU06564.1 pilus assembly protein [Novosphingobium guangzhouense]